MTISITLIQEKKLKEVFLQIKILMVSKDALKDFRKNIVRKIHVSKTLLVLIKYGALLMS